ncbi:MAG: ISL3 family transposase [Hyphomicrobium sp.]|jgi:transposase
MRNTDLFQLALGLVPPWLVNDVRFDANKKQLDIEIDFARGGRFPCPNCNAADCPVHDTAMQKWRHLDFFQHQAFLHARTPRITCPTCGVKQIAVPWARAGSGFTLLFEALAMTLVTHMPVRAAANLLNEHDTRIWRIVGHYVEQAVARMDLAEISRVCIDETAAKRGHNYISLFVDIDARKTVFVTEGRAAATVAAFADHVDDHNSDASRIKEVCIDMSAAYIKGVTENLTEAEITFDKFHAVKLVNDAVDQVRRIESKTQPSLKGSRYVWLKNEANLSAGQSATLGTLAHTNLKTARAYRMRLAFQEVYAQPTRGWGELFLDRWIGWVKRSRLEPMKAVAKTIERYRDGILAWFDSRIANGLIEGINSIVQAAKAKARGYRSIRNLINMTYLITGKLDLKLPT